jgi:hypothetical protein
LVGGERPGLLLRGVRLDEPRPLLHDPHLGDAVAARVGDPIGVDLDDRPHAGHRREERKQFLEPRGAGEVGDAPAVHPHHTRRATEGAEHHHDAAVLLQVGDRLDTAAGDIEVGEAPITEDRQRAGQALGRDVDVALVGAWRRPDEEHRLAQEEGGEPLVDPVVDLGHSQW